MKTSLLLAFLSLLPLAGGCASIAVTDEAIVDRTAFALGLAKGDFTTDNRMDDGAATRFHVRTTSGQNYRCFVGGSIGLLGRSVSEAACTKEGEATRNRLLSRRANSCGRGTVHV